MPNLGDPLKLLPLLVSAIAGAGLLMGKLSVNDAVGMLAAAGVLHSGISAVNNVNPK